MQIVSNCCDFPEDISREKTVNLSLWERIMSSMNSNNLHVEDM